jgi:hypothetical protein
MYTAIYESLKKALPFRRLSLDIRRELLLRS